MNRYKSVFNVLITVLSVFGALGALPVKQTQAFATDLFFSEYIEGSSNNRAIEIYNGTGASVNLQLYSVELYSAGISVPSDTLTFTFPKWLADGSTYNIVNPYANATLLDLADVESTVTNYSGDDPLVLKHNGVVIDSVGQVGIDPGTNWSANGVVTSEQTLVRMPSVCSGDTVPSDVFDPSAEWLSNAQNTFTYFGSHTANCSTTAMSTVTSTTPADLDTDVAINANISLLFDQSVAFAADAASITCGAASTTHTYVVDSTNNPVIMLDPALDFGYSETCSVIIDATKVTPAMATNFTFSFTTVAEPTLPPSVAAITPTDGATGQERNTSFVVEFDQAVTLTQPWFDVSCPSSTGITFGASVIGNTYTITPSGLLAYADTCSLTITAAKVRSAASDLVMTADFVSAFTVKTDDAPALVNSVPANGAVNVAKDSPITLTFNEAVDVSATGIAFSCSITGNVPFAVAMAPDDATTWNITHDPIPQGGQTCTLTVPAASVTDQDLLDPPDTMATDIVITFTPTPCGDAYTPIYNIQESVASSPLVGTTVTTEGVVVGDFQVGGKAGYFIQDPSGDDNPATSDGIFVYNTSVAVNVGDSVRVKGAVSEWATETDGDTLTELTPTSPAASNVTICSTGNTIAPTTVSLPVSLVSDFEKYEGMLVTFPQALVISEYFDYDRYGEIVLTSRRHMTPTAVVEPGAPAQAEAAAFLLDRITLDDGRSTSNPDPARHPNGLTFNLNNLFRGGDTVQ